MPGVSRHAMAAQRIPKQCVLMRQSRSKNKTVSIRWICRPRAPMCTMDRVQVDVNAADLLPRPKAAANATAPAAAAFAAEAPTDELGDASADAADVVEDFVLSDDDEGSDSGGALEFDTGDTALRGTAAGAKHHGADRGVRSKKARGPARADAVAHGKKRLRARSPKSPHKKKRK